MIDESEETRKNNLEEDQTTPQLPSDEDMEDLLEHIEEDVEIPDDDEEDEDLEDVEMTLKKSEDEAMEVIMASAAAGGPPGSNGHLSAAAENLSKHGEGGPSNGILPKLPPLPPLPPPLLNLEFLKVMTKYLIFLKIST